MANIYSIAYSVIGVIVLHAAMLVWMALILPRPVRRTRVRLETQPLACFAWGVVCALLLALVLGGFLAVRARYIGPVNDQLQWFSERLGFARFYNDAWIITNSLMWFLMAPFLAAYVVGGAAFSQLFASRANQLGRGDRPFASLLCGALCTSASYFVPAIGWFVYLPIVGLMSLGAGAWGLCSRQEAGLP